MKHFFVMMAFAAFAISCSTNKDQNSPLNPANFTTVEWLDSTVSFGSVKPGDPIVVKFRCKNTGSKPLVLTNVKPSCGCTLADYTKEPIQPGAEGWVSGSITNKNLSGEVRKSIVVNTNTSNHAEQVLFIEGIVNTGDDAVQTVKPDIKIKVIPNKN